MSRRRRLAAWLLLACTIACAAAVVIAVQVGQWRDQAIADLRARPLAADSIASLEVPREPLLLSAPFPADLFSETVERPLFMSTRRPPVQVVEVEQEAAPVENVSHAPPNVVITAILLTEQQRVAALRHQGESKRIREGDRVEGWRVTAIHGDRVVFSQDGLSHEVKLRDFSRPPPQPRRIDRARTRQRDARSVARSRRGEDPPAKPQPGQDPTPKDDAATDDAAPEGEAGKGG